MTTPQDLAGMSRPMAGDPAPQADSPPPPAVPPSPDDVVHDILISVLPDEEFTGQPRNTRILIEIPMAIMHGLAPETVVRAFQLFLSGLGPKQGG